MITIKTDSINASFNEKDMALTVDRGEPCLTFKSEDGVCEIRMYPKADEKFYKYLNS